MSEEKPFDWRIEAISKLVKPLPAAYPGGPAHDAGSLVYLTTVTKKSNGDQIGFITPSSIALALNIAFNAMTKAIEIKKMLKFNPAIGPSGSVATVPFEQTDLIFNYFENCMTNVTFSFQSIEAFCNYSISRNLHKVKEVKDKRKKAVSPSETERQLSTEEKLKRVIPDIYNKPTPAGKHIWDKFLKLKHARDSLIHIKYVDQCPLDNIDTESLYFQFLDIEPEHFPQIAIEILRYWFSDEDMPSWLKNVPF
jgi:hypothetical protein